MWMKGEVGTFPAGPSVFYGVCGLALGVQGSCRLRSLGKGVLFGFRFWFGLSSAPKQTNS